VRPFDLPSTKKQQDMPWFGSGFRKCFPERSAIGEEAMEQRLSYLEQIIIIIIVTGGWKPPHGSPGDSFASDTTRVEALLHRLGGRGPIPDPITSDISRLSVTDVEHKSHEVAAAITRLQAQHGELQARLKELRASESTPKAR